MEGFRGGSLLKTVERHIGGESETARAEAFLLFGLLAEIFMRSNGFNGGMGGSMHLIDPDRGFLGGDDRVIGSAISIRGATFSVSGVAAPDFAGLDLERQVDVWVPTSAWKAWTGNPDVLDMHPVSKCRRGKLGNMIPTGTISQFCQVSQ